MCCVQNSIVCVTPDSVGVGEPVLLRRGRIIVLVFMIVAVFVARLVARRKVRAAWLLIAIHGFFQLALRDGDLTINPVVV